MNIDTFIPLFIALVGALPGIIAIIYQRRKQVSENRSTDINAAGTLTKSVLDLLDAKDHEVDDLQAEIKDLRAQLRGLQTRNDELFEEKKRHQAHIQLLEQNAQELSRTLRDCNEQRVKLQQELDSYNLSKTE